MSSTLMILDTSDTIRDLNVSLHPFSDATVVFESLGHPLVQPVQ